MRSIEEQIGISENAKKAFREEILNSYYQLMQEKEKNSITIPMKDYVKPFKKNYLRI